MVKSTQARAVATAPTVAVIPAHRDVSLERMRAYIESGDGGYWTVHAIAWSPDGRYWASAGADDTLRVWDATTHRQLKIHVWNRPGGKVLDLLWSPDSKYIGILANSGPTHQASAHHAPTCQVSVMDALTGEEVYRDANLLGSELAWLPAHPASSISPQDIAVYVCDPSRTWSSDGRYLIASDDKPAGDSEPQRMIPIPAPHDATAHEHPPDSLRNGRRVTSGAVRIVERATGRVTISLPHGTSWVAWSPAGSRIASIQRKTAAIWDAAEGTLLCSYRGHTGWFTHVTCLSWAPSGRSIASGDSVGVIHVWQI